jgi:hypothetical protein
MALEVAFTLAMGDSMQYQLEIPLANRLLSLTP